MRNTIEALGDNAKFYPNYMANHLAADFKFHLDKGIGRIIENNSRLTEENAKLRQILKYAVKVANDPNATYTAIEVLNIEAQQLLNQLKDQNNDK
ncbi:hypothetical protein [Vibrio phage P23]|nr:hypothetical protein [Vibrio phage P23]